MGRPPMPEWEQAIEHELKRVECTECTMTATWLRTYEQTYEPKADQIDVFVCRSCGHEMHILHDEVDQVAEAPEPKLTPDQRPIRLKPEDAG
jgi:RNase P subunit RPR2